MLRLYSTELNGNKWMTNWKGVERSGCCIVLRLFPGIRLDRLRKSTRILSQDSRSSIRDLNPKTPEYETGVLTFQPRSSVLENFES
jgi:hypothetical protein